MTDRYAVIGNPIAHSRSPQIHAAFAAQTRQDIVYQRILGDPAGFEADIAAFFAADGHGLNVTVPFKARAARACAVLSDRARLAGAANTLTRRDGVLHGDNTDGPGLVRDLAVNHGLDLSGKRLLVLGAGGAVRGVVRPLLDAGPATLLIANRTPSKAIALAREAGTDGCGLDDLGGQTFDLIINGTAAGLRAEVPAIPDDCLAPGGWTYDMFYSQAPTAFVDWGREHGAAKALDGLGMLVEQAAESFWIWRGVRPETAAIIAELRAH